MQVFTNANGLRGLILTALVLSFIFTRGYEVGICEISLLHVFHVAALSDQSIPNSMLHTQCICETG